MTKITFDYGLMADIDDENALKALLDITLRACKNADQYSSGHYRQEDFTVITCDDLHVTILRNSVLQKVLNGFDITPEIRKDVLAKLKNEAAPEIIFSDKIGFVRVEKDGEVKASLFIGVDNQDEWRSYLLKSLNYLKLSMSFNKQAIDKNILKSIHDFEDFIKTKSDEIPYFHISLANISNGNPHKSVGNVSRKIARQNKLI